MINEFGKSFFSYKGVGHLYRVPTWSIFLKDYIVLTHYFSWQIFWTLSGAIKLTYGINWLRFIKRDFLLFPLCMDNTEREQLNLSLVNSILYHRLIRGSDQWWRNVCVCVCVSEYVCVFLWVCVCEWVGARVGVGGVIWGIGIYDYKWIGGLNARCRFLCVLLWWIYFNVRGVSHFNI